MNTRRGFLQKGLLGLSGIVLGSTIQSTAQAAPPTKKIKEDPFHLGVAGFSFVNFKLDESLAMMRRLDIKYLCIKDFHLPYNSTENEIANFHEKLKHSEVIGYAVGPIYTKSEKEIDDAFDYASRVGVNLIIGVPSPEDLAYLSDKVKATGIKYAIHNHGPEDKLYPNATIIYNLIKDLHQNVGICFDMGHDARDGQDVIKDVQNYHRRIFDIHLKNVTSATAEGSTTELGRGVINIPLFIKALRKVNYNGKCSLEHEKDMKDPLAGLAESAGYFRGVSDT
ncbi:sugar phosphate isomerase/epimerase family protein [Sphingobacterium corticibacterium]|uniref:Sugar phosphate isomerase/epimerase n=1 Tax=Sphingobacterium corticibacterium TaxID=2484746 RepID=A0A4Q6XN61_9SPHI|nr:sugar phosphate isomerase/epimerase [Sphingobacterium corticibacterium]RZF58704.1 sugar phosphate isomerase/epimerase [Sphingobacterium corticibacterium]